MSLEAWRLLRVVEMRLPRFIDARMVLARREHSYDAA